MSEHDYRSDGASRPILEPLTRIEPIPVRAVFVAESSEGRWQEKRWRLAAVDPCEPDDDAPLALEIFPDEADGYYLNLTSGEPSIFVKWRMPGDESGVSGAGGEPSAIAVSLSYNEAGRWMDGGERVDRVAMPPELAAWLAEFVNLHWVPEKKRKRRGAKPSFMPRAQFAQMTERERQIMERLASEGSAASDATVQGGAGMRGPGGEGPAAAEGRHRE